MSRIIKEAKEIINSNKTIISGYRDYLIPEMWERNVSEVSHTKLVDAILVAEYYTGLSFKRKPKEILRFVNISINLN